MGKTLSLKLNDKEKKKVDQYLKKEGITPSKLFRKALWQYINGVNREVNLSQQEKKQGKVDYVDQKVNHNLQEKDNKKVNLSPKKVNLSQQKEHSQEVNQVNPGIQVIENYELIEYLKRDHEWLQDRIKHFENTQDTILAKLDIKPVDKDKPSVSWVRM